MIVSPDALRKDVVTLLKSIDAQIEEVEAEAQVNGILPQQMRDSKGDWVMNQLLLAKVTAYSALVQLNEQRKR